MVCESNFTFHKFLPDQKKGRSSTTNLAKVIEMGWSGRALKLMVRNILTKLLEVKGIGLDYVAW